MIGKTLAHFRVLSKIGEGGMGEVYRARDTKLDRDVALKIVSAEMAKDPERLERFRREARAIAAMNHPNIVTIHSVEEHEDRPFLAMELIDGETLTDLIPPEGIGLRRLLDLSIGIAEAVSAAHERGVTHRDLKPGNVMVTRDDRVKVLDFGLAKLREEVVEGDATQLPTRPVTAEGRILGTVAYMAPEVLQGRPAEPRSDIFSLGVVLYEMATGRRPFSGESSADLISSILRDAPAPISDLAPGLPRHLGRIVRRCLEKDPERRYQTVKDVRNELQGLRHEVTSGDVPIQAPPRGQAARETTPAPAGASGAAPSRAARIGAIGAVLAIVAIAAAFLLLRRDGPEAPAGAVHPASRALAVVGFENLADPADGEQIGRMLSALIATDLTETGGLSVVSTSKVLAAIREASRGDRSAFEASVASDAAARAGADLMLAGQIGRAGERLILTAELAEVGSGKTLGSIRKEADSSAELFALAGAIATEVRGRLGVAGANARTSFDLAKAITSSAEAYRHFAAGEAAMHRNEWSAAVGHFDAAIRADPSFALAYYRLGLAVGWQGTDSGATAVERGLPHVGRLPERWRVLYHAYLDYARGDADTAHEALSRLVESADDLADAHYHLGEICTHYGRYLDYARARRHFERALAIDPTFRIALIHLVEDHALADDPAGARRLIRAQFPGGDAPHLLEAIVLRAEGRYDESADLAARLAPDQIEHRYWALAAADRWDRLEELAEGHLLEPSAGWTHEVALENRGKARVGKGRLTAALADLRQVSASLSRKVVQAHYSGWVEGQVIEILLATGDHRGAISAAREALARTPSSPVAQYILGRTLALAGRADEGESILARMRRDAEGAPSPWPAYLAHLLEAELRLAGGDASAAEASLATVASSPIENRFPALEAELLGRAREAGGDRRAALAAWETIFLPRSRYELAVVQESRALYEIGRLNDELGRKDEAREHYRRFLARWGEADLPVPEVARATERLAAL